MLVSPVPKYNTTIHTRVTEHHDVVNAFSIRLTPVPIPLEAVSSSAPNEQGGTSLSKRAKHTVWEKGRVKQSGTYKIQEGGIAMGTSISQRAFDTDFNFNTFVNKVKGYLRAIPKSKAGTYHSLMTTWGWKINIQMLCGSGYYPGSMPTDLWDRPLEDLKYYMAESVILGQNSVWFQVWGEGGYEALWSVEVAPSDARQG
ncbi:hypothetical protein BGZ95_005154 [Linnemannia exigua]|uniref:Uncharacterized protein n=1 Tax=Linnemannia exigua TaxID=604196 RepID=A0AAD4H1Q5_9FUNG|nr:hypothetical protein BGZ95_005154 [Linnemannia exigua]